jgi:hypothetical protein
MKAVSYRFNEYDIGGGMAQSILKKREGIGMYLLFRLPTCLCS